MGYEVTVKCLCRVWRLGWGGGSCVWEQCAVVHEAGTVSCVAFAGRMANACVCCELMCVHIGTSSSSEQSSLTALLPPSKHTHGATMVCANASRAPPNTSLRHRSLTFHRVTFHKVTCWVFFPSRPMLAHLCVKHPLFDTYVGPSADAVEAKV